MLQEILKNVSKVALSLIIGLALLGSLQPVPARADDEPIDLRLGGTGGSPWNVANIKPSDTGIETLELRNAGSRDGFVSIWISDIVSIDGFNSKAESGDLEDHLIFDLKAAGLVTNLHLPVKISDLPQGATDSNYIEIIPLKSGTTVDLEWEWELPAKTGNEVQGDILSFTINYMLRECVVTDVSSVVTAGGVFTQDITTRSYDNKGKIVINAGTTGKTAANQPLSDIWIIEIDKTPLPAPPNQTNVSLNYEAGPEGATFDQPVYITLSYNPDNVPVGVSESQLYLAVWNKATGQWDKLTTYTINTLNKTITAPVYHFSRYTVLSPISAPAPPTPPPVPSPPDEEEYEEPEPVTPPVLSVPVDIDMLGKKSVIETGTDGTVREALILSDAAGNFVIAIDKDTRITSLEGELLKRIDLRITDKQVTLSDGIVLLTPVYELMGYGAGMESTPVFFKPPARLTIRYDPEKLPEYAFQPFIATYSDDKGLVRLNEPPGLLIETGVANALVENESLFTVVVKKAPPPPPLPAMFEVSNLIISPVKSYVGEPVSISITIANKGALEGTYELYLIIDGIVRAIEKVTLTGDSTQTITFEVSNLAPGSHQVKIAGLTGEFQIIRVEAAIPAGGVTNWLITDLGVGVLIVAGLLALYLVIRRSQKVPRHEYSSDEAGKVLRRKRDDGNMG